MRNTSIVLIVPCSSTTGGKDDFRTTMGLPLSFLYLAGAVRKICPDVHIFDYNTRGNDDAALKRLLDAARPFVVGITVMFGGDFPEVRRLAVAIKEWRPQGKIVIGGSHATVFAKEIMENCPCIDAICLGESDTTFPALLAYYQNATETPPLNILQQSEITGFMLRIGETVHVSEKKNYIANLDALPMPGYEYFDFNEYRVKTATLFNPGKLEISEVLMPLLTSRSCPNQCPFCSMRLVMGSRFRMRSPEHVVAEIKFCYEQYGINYFIVQDDNFTFNKQRTLDICNLIIKNKLDIYLAFNAGLMIRTLDDEIINALYNAGGIRFALAIESGNDYIRNTLLRKNCSKEKIFSVVNTFRKYNVLVQAFFMIGFPEETEETLLDTLQMIELIDIDSIDLNRVRPYPGTKLFTQCVQDALFINPVAIKSLWKGTDIADINMFQSQFTEFYIKPYAISLETMKEYEARISAVIKKKALKTVLAHFRKKSARNA